jgi:Lon protease-like protein
MKSNSDDELLTTSTEYGWTMSPEVFNSIKNMMLPELDCKVCTEIFVDPITTPCGHTFCKSCITRSLDHSDKCPLCRHPLTNYTYFQHHPINMSIFNLLQSFYSELYSQRQAALEHELYHNMQETPIFVCSLVFPRMPCFIHVFEPRYRLMIRRCLESRQRRFGMVLSDRNGQGYRDYGTMLEIRSIEFLPDGRSLIETVGSYRFRVIERGMRDGYNVGKVERIDDLDPEQEEELERKAISRAQLNNADANNPRMEEPTTAELIATAREFIESLRNGSAPWILQRLNSAYGEMPDNPAGFSFWVASVIPVDESEKSKLLEIRSVRERLKLINSWINQLREQWWFARGCSIS